MASISTISFEATSPECGFKLPLFPQFLDRDEIPPTTPLGTRVRTGAVLSTVLVEQGDEYSSIPDLTLPQLFEGS